MLASRVSLVSRSSARPNVRPPDVDPASVVLTYRVPNELGGQRLDRFIQWAIPRLSRTRAQEIVRACARRSDGSARRPSEIVRVGETVMLVRERFVEPEVPLEYSILHEDETLFVIDKPAGLPMHPTATYHKHTLSYLLKQRYGEDPPRISHRLDRETSGVVLCTKGLAAERVMKAQFERHAVSKTYQALVRGVVAADRGRIDLPMAPVTEGLHLLMEICEGARGLTAETEYVVLERYADRTLLELYPRTGRQHQLRVHLSAIGHPIVGDKLYGPEREAPFLEIIDVGLTPDILARLGHSRHALHAHKTTFIHPSTGESTTVISPLAPDIVQLCAQA